MSATDKAIELAPSKFGDHGYLREASVSVTAASAAPTQCPVCRGSNVMVQGIFARRFSEEIAAGKSAGYELGDDLIKSVMAVMCDACKVRYNIEPDAVFALRKRVLELEMELGKRDLLTVAEGSERVQ